MTLIVAQLVLLLVLIALSAFFSGSETALFSLSRARLLEYGRSQRYAENLVAKLMRRYHQTLIVLILGNMFVNSAISITNDALVCGLNLPPMLTTCLSILIAVALLLFLGEITPKAIAIANAETVSTQVAPFIWFPSKILSPLILLVDKAFKLILDLIGRQEAKPLNQDEYSSYIEIAYSLGAFSDEEADLLERAMELSRRAVNKVMTQRVDIACLDASTSGDDLAALIRDKRQKYFLLVEDGDIDDADRVVSAKLFFTLDHSARREWLHSNCVSKPPLIPENASLTKALSMLRRATAPVGLVIGEYGGTAGMIDIEEIYENLVGDIDDEHDEPDWQIVQSEPNSWRINGTIDLEELEELFDWDGPETGANTLNGLMSDHLGRIPVPGDAMTVNGLRFSVSRTSQNRVVEFEVSKVDP